MEMTKSLIDYWWLVVFRGLLAVLFGIAAIAVPGKTLMFLVVFLGVYLLLEGAIQILLALFSIKKTSDWWIILLIGMLTVAIGMLVLNWPEATLKVLFFLLGIWAMFMGLLMMVMAFVTRKESYGGWLLGAIGALAMLFGLLLFSNPVQTISALTVLVGLFVFISGIMTVAFGMELRSMKKDVDKVVKYVTEGDKQVEGKK